jgi:hypothetical protein
MSIWDQFDMSQDGYLCCPECGKMIRGTIDATYYGVALIAPQGLNDDYPSYDYGDNEGAESQVMEDSSLDCRSCGWSPYLEA